MPSSSTISQLLRATVAALHDGGIGNARQEAEWLLRRVADFSRTAIYTDPDKRVDPDAVARLQPLLERRLGGEPLQYILGDTEFFGLELAVGPGVLIPRPETERLVELALDHYPGSGAICDLCTGSGAIALALASQLKGAVDIAAVDISPAALAYARRNRDQLGLIKVALYEGDLFAPLPPSLRFSLITANPPYIDPVAYAELDTQVRDHEPELALAAANRGLAVLERIADLSRKRLRQDAWIFCEIGSDQGSEVLDLFRRFDYRQVRIHRDYCNRDRILQAQAPETSQR